MKPTYRVFTPIPPIQNPNVLAFTPDRQFVTDREAAIRLNHLIDREFHPKAALH